MSNSHEFALYYERAHAREVGQEIVITDSDVVHRVMRVLRLGPGSNCIIFNRVISINCVVRACTKKSCTLEVRLCKDVLPVMPRLTWFLPVLEREQFEHALYMLSVLGAHTIVPVVTDKSRSKWGKPKDYERAHRVMVSAAEQSKQFYLPELAPVKKFADCLALCSQEQEKIFFDPDGIDFFDFITQVRESKHKDSLDIVFLVGPEGDLTNQEKSLIAQHNFVSCRLTPMILKASHAVTIAMGSLRALI